MSSMAKVLTGVVALACTLVFAGGSAHASHVTCGQTITQTTVLDSNLPDCPGDGVVIGADNITLDLGRHTIDGRGGFSGVSNDGSYDGITIKNGRIKQFEFAVDMYEAHDVAVTGMFFTDIISHAVLFVRSNNCSLRNSISTGNGAGLINPLESTNCIIERNASYATGSNRGESIFLFKTRNITVRWNWVSGAYRGIHVGSATDNVIKHNLLWGNVRGIEVFDSTGTQILWNAATNSQESGIHIWGDVAGTHVAGTRIIGNLARHNGDDGVHIDAPDTFVARNWANRNADLGIQAAPGVTDGGGNHARNNGNPAQCTNVAC